MRILGSILLAVLFAQAAGETAIGEGEAVIEGGLIGPARDIALSHARWDAVSKSALDLAWHIAATEMRFLEAIAAGEFDLTPRPKPESITNSAEMTAAATPGRCACR